MSLRSDLFAYWKTKSSITDEFGTSDNMRVYPGMAPSSATFPYATWEIISDTPFHHLEAATRITDATMQIDVWADTALAAFDGADGFRTAMDGYNEGTMTSVDVRWIALLDRRDELIPPDDNSENAIYRVSSDYQIFYVTSVPTF